MIYFDNAATGFPKDKNAVYEITKAIKNCGNPGRSGHKYSIYASEILYSTREELANLFNTVPEKVILCPSTTYALNIAIKGLYNPKGKILISDLEHNSVIRPSVSLGETEVFIVDMDDDNVTLENFKSKISCDVSIVVVTHASNVCGRILPIEKIASICNQYKIPIIVDASQTAGYLQIDLKKYSIDAVCIPGHKGFYGPMGTGALIINSQKNLFFKTIIQGGTGILSSETEMPIELPERLEAGTVCVHNFAGLTAALKRCKFESNYQEMFLFLNDELSRIKNIKQYGFSTKCKEQYMPIILFNCLDIVSYDFSDMLSERGFCVRSGFHCSPLAHRKFKTGDNGAVRISLGKKNTMNECERLISVIKEFCGK